MKKNFSIDCILPTYNEAKHLADFIKVLHTTLSNFTSKIKIIIVNDGSKDDTEKIVQEIINSYPICYISLSRNFGKEAALSAGIAHADGDVVLLIDADFQHPVELVPEMLQLWNIGYDMIYGVINDRTEESGLKRLSVKLLYKIINLGNKKFSIPSNAGDFRLIDKKVIDALKLLPERRRFMKGLYAWVGFKTIAMPFKPAKRLAGTSSFNFMNLFNLAITGIASFTTVPLKVSGIFGLLISFTSIIYALYIAISTIFFGNEVPGWATLVVGLSFLSGVQLVIIGVLGEYVGQIYEEVKNRPLYIVDKHEISKKINPK